MDGEEEACDNDDANEEVGRRNLFPSKVFYMEEVEVEEAFHDGKEGMAHVVLSFQSMEEGEVACGNGGDDGDEARMVSSLQILQSAFS